MAVLLIGGGPYRSELWLRLATRGARAPSVAGILVGLVGGAALAACYPLPDDPRGAEPEWAGARWDPCIAVSRRRRSRRSEAPSDGIWTDRSYLGLSISVLAALGFLRSLLDRREAGRGIGPIPLAVLILLPWVHRHRPGSTIWTWPCSARRSPRQAPFGADCGPRAIRSCAGASFPWRSSWSSSTFRPSASSRPTSYSGTERIRPTRNSRTGWGADGSSSSSSHPRGSAWLLYGYAADRPVAAAVGPFVQETPRAFVHMAALMDTVASSLSKTPRLDRNLIDLLALHDIRYIVLDLERGVKVPKGIESDGLVLDRDIPALRVEAATPVAILEPGSARGPVAPAVVFESGAFPPPRSSGPCPRRHRDGSNPPGLEFVTEARSVVLPNRLEIELPDLGPVDDSHRPEQPPANGGPASTAGRGLGAMGRSAGS